MSKAVRIANDVVAEIFGDTLPQLHPDLLPLCRTDAPDDVQVGWLFDDDTDTYSEKPRTVEEAKSEALSNALIYFQDRLIFGVEHPAATFQYWSADDTNMRLYQNAAILANSAIQGIAADAVVDPSLTDYQTGGNYNIVWPVGYFLTTRDGNDIPLANPGDATKLFEAVAEFLKYCQGVYIDHVDAINALNDVAAIDAYDYTANYPS